MDVVRYRDSNGGFWREVISRQYDRLKELQVQYEAKGLKTWFNLYDACEGQWMLTILEAS